MSIRDELQQKGYLRLGMVAIGLLLWLFTLQALDESVTRLRETADLLQGQIARTNELLSEDYWADYREKMHRSLAEFRARAWRAESEGRIQAYFQDWIREQQLTSGLKLREIVVSLPEGGSIDPQVEVGGQGRVGEAASEVSPLPAEMRVVRARLVFDFQSNAFHELLSSFSQSEHWVWVERLRVENGRTRTVELDLGALFVIGPRESV